MDALDACLKRTEKALIQFVEDTDRAQIEAIAKLKRRHTAKMDEIEHKLMNSQQKEISLNTQISDVTASLKCAESNHLDSVNCVICHNNRKTISFSPCHHMCCCETCASDPRLDNKCPMCRADITSKTRTFW